MGTVQLRKPPASQGAAARRAVFELDEERRKREDLERQLDELKAQAASHQGMGKGRALWEGGEEVAEGDGTDADMTKKIKELQTELWRAKGEAESVRRAQRDVSGGEVPVPGKKPLLTWLGARQTPRRGRKAPQPAGRHAKAAAREGE
jgi:hypothetical protein